MKCPSCGSENAADYKFCQSCGKELTSPAIDIPAANQSAPSEVNTPPAPQVHVAQESVNQAPNQQQAPNSSTPYQPPGYQPYQAPFNQNASTPDNKQTNGLGIAGFILSLISIVFGWFPFFGWVVWLLGLVFSIIGLTKQPKGFAIAGLIISVLSLIVIICIYALAVTDFSYYYY